MKKLTFTLLLTLILSLKLFSQDTLFFKADYLPAVDTVLVFTPEGYSSDNDPLPVVYLLHGWAGSYKQWPKNSPLQEYADFYNMILVCPDGFYDGWYFDNPFRPEIQFEKFFWNDLAPEIDSKYNINPQFRFITGLSMGGHGAVTLFLKNPSYFLSAGSTSGILDITKFTDRWALKAGLGEYSEYPENWKNNSAIYLLENLEGFDKTIFFDCGTEDFAFDVNHAFFQKCRELKIKAQFTARPGKHSHDYWRASLPHHLDYFKQLIINN